MFNALVFSISFCGILQAGPVPHPNLPNAVVVVRATGFGHPPRHMRGAQARLMARRAAEVRAVQCLAEKLGVPAGARTGPFQYVEVKYLPGGAVQVTVEAIRTRVQPHRR